MTKKTYLGDIMETCCPNCHSHYRITDEQLQAAFGRAKCSQCGMVFNALQSLKSYEGELPPDYQLPSASKSSSANAEQAEDWGNRADDRPSEAELSLHEAMYGYKRNSLAYYSPFLWFIGILILIVFSIAQTVYYQRYKLIKTPRFQQQVLSLCEIIPCGKQQFSSINQIKLLERNVFTHPVTSNALMVTGSFVNQAPFPQRLPRMLVSLFDIKGELIANRVFGPEEYLQDSDNKTSAKIDIPVQFRLEIVDPGTDALTYEFEFY